MAIRAQPPPEQAVALPPESTKFPSQGLQRSPATAELPWEPSVVRVEQEAVTMVT